jgi:integrase
MAQHKLSARRVKAVRKPGYFGDGGNLYLQVSRSHTKSWIFRYGMHGKTREMGLGPLALVSLAEARDKALACRKLLLEGRDPIEARRGQRTQERLEAAKAITFRQCAASYIKAHEAAWRNEKHRYQWRQTLDIACETLGDLPVASVDTSLVMKVLEPLWHTKTETAKRLRGRIEAVLDLAIAHEFRTGPNPARWRGHLDKLLVKPRKAVKHHPALPYAELPQFMAELRANNSVSARALEFTILTACRTNEVIGARWDDEIDRDAKVWTIPAGRMKAKKAHRVPLCHRALNILSSLPREDGNPFVFIGGATGKPLHSLAMLELFRTMRPDLTVHGFRSTFRDWAAERTNFPREVVERAMAHTLRDKTEAAYQRGDLLDKRRPLMAEWARYCEQTPIASDTATAQTPDRDCPSRTRAPRRVAHGPWVAPSPRDERPGSGFVPVHHRVSARPPRWRETRPPAWRSGRAVHL